MRESWIFVPHGHWFTSAKIRGLKPSSGGNNSWDERELNLCAAWSLIYFSEDKRTETLKRRETTVEMRENLRFEPQWPLIYFSEDKRTETLNRREQLRWERVDFFVPSWPLIYFSEDKMITKSLKRREQLRENYWSFCAVMATDWTKCKKMFGGAVRPLMHSWIF